MTETAREGERERASECMCSCYYFLVYTNMSRILCIFLVTAAAAFTLCVVMSESDAVASASTRIRRSYQPTSECIRYEFHETFGNGSQVDSIMRNCQSHNGYLDKLTRFTMNKRTYLVNVTFECCGKCCSHYFEPWKASETLASRRIFSRETTTRLSE